MNTTNTRQEIIMADCPESKILNPTNSSSPTRCPTLQPSPSPSHHPTGVTTAVNHMTSPVVSSTDKSCPFPSSAFSSAQNVTLPVLDSSDSPPHSSCTKPSSPQAPAAFLTASLSTQTKIVDAVSSGASLSFHSSSGPICRICLEGDAHQDLISPCLCSGTLAAVHKACLEKWLTLAKEEQCELCGYTFTLSRHPKPFWEFVLRCDSNEIRRALLVDSLCFLVLTPLAILSIYLCVIGALNYVNERTRLSSNYTIHLIEVVKISDFNKKELQEINGRQIIGPERKFKETEYSQLGPRYKPEGERRLKWEGLGLIMLAVFLFCIYLTWAVAVIKYHIDAWRRWRLVHQDVHLVEDHLMGNSVSSVDNALQMQNDVIPESPRDVEVFLSPSFSARAHETVISCSSISSLQDVQDVQMKKDCAYNMNAIEGKQQPFSKDVLDDKREYVSLASSPIFELLSARRLYTFSNSSGESLVGITHL